MELPTRTTSSWVQGRWKAGDAVLMRRCSLLWCEASQRRSGGLVDESDLFERARCGDRDALDELVEAASARSDLDLLRRLAGLGSSDAVDELVQLAGELEDLDELRRLAEAGSSDAQDVLDELTGDAG
jgi:hypothetical protein